MRLYLDANAIVFAVEATDLHREFSLKTIDALHVASAIAVRADVLLTRDTGINRYKSFRGVACEAIPAGR